jgi:hypothetical protein
MVKKVNVEIPSEQRLTDYTLMKAGFDLYCAEYADVFEEHGGSFGGGAVINDCVAKPDTNRLIEIMRVYEQELANAWGKAPGWVYAEMGLEDEDDIADALYYTMMACRGHGVGLKDDHGKEIDMYEEKHGALNTTPYHTELTKLRDFADQNLETPTKNWGVYDKKGKLVDDRFHSNEAAARWLRDTGCDKDGYTSRFVGN